MIPTEPPTAGTDDTLKSDLSQVEPGLRSKVMIPARAANGKPELPKTGTGFPSSFPKASCGVAERELAILAPSHIWQAHGAGVSQT